MASAHPFVGWGNGTLLFVTFAVVAVGFTVALDAVMRRLVSPEVRSRAGPTAAVTLQVLATIYAVLVAFVIVNEYSQLRAANDQVAAKGAELSAMYDNSRVFPPEEGDGLRRAIISYTRAVVDHGFPHLARTREPDPLSGHRIERIFAALQSIRPATAQESAAYTKSLDLLDGVAETRARIVNAAGVTVPWPLVLLLAFMGITVLVVGSVLDTRHRKSHLLILTALALVVSLTLALVVSLNYPFDGVLPISSDALRDFLEFRAAR